MREGAHKGHPPTPRTIRGERIPTDARDVFPLPTSDPLGSHYKLNYLYTAMGGKENSHTATSRKRLRIRQDRHAIPNISLCHATAQK